MQYLTYCVKYYGYSWKMRSSRLLAMLLLLQARSPRSASELSKELEVSARTVYRDAEALSSSGVPVFAERGRNGGIALLPGYRTQVPGLSPDEAKALFVMMTDAAHVDLGLGDAFGSALRKVLASLPASHQDTAESIGRRVLVDPARWGAVDERPVHLGQVQTAVLDGNRLRLNYRSGSGKTKAYTLDPYGLVHKAGVWYLVAAHRRSIKTFRLDRVRAAAVLGAPSRRPAGFDLAATWADLQREYTASLASVSVRVRVRRRIAPRVWRLHGDGRDAGASSIDVGRDLDEWVEMTMHFPVLAAAQALLAHGADLEVIDPPELRELLRRIATEIAAQYSTTPGHPGGGDCRAPDSGVVPSAPSPGVAEPSSQAQ